MSIINTLKQLNGDLRALILVSSTRNELLTEQLMEALKTLKKRVESQHPKEKDENSENSSKTLGDAGAPDQPPPKVTKVCSFFLFL